MPILDFSDEAYQSFTLERKLNVEQVSSLKNYQDQLSVAFYDTLNKQSESKKDFIKENLRKLIDQQHLNQNSRNEAPPKKLSALNSGHSNNLKVIGSKKMPYGSQSSSSHKLDSNINKIEEALHNHTLNMLSKTPGTGHTVLAHSPPGSR